MLVPTEIRGPSDEAADKVDPIVDAMAGVQRANPAFYVGSFGESTGKEIQGAFYDDLKKAGLFSVPLTLLILVFAFGALVAAGIPLLLGLTAVLGTMGLVALFSQVLPMDDSVPAIILLIGLAVGVDYTMFYLKREREERAAGRREEAALEAAAATSGRSVLISGSTVLVAMAGMFLTGDAGFASFGVATMTVVAVAMLGSLTVLPALLSKLGDGVDRARVPFVHRLRRSDGEGRIWGAIIDRVLRRPVLSVALAGGLLIALAVPALQLHTAEASIDSYPQKFLTSYNRVKAAFPGTEIAANVVIKAPNVEAPRVRDAIGQLKRRALATGVMNEPIDVDVNPAKTVASISIPVEGNGTDSTSNAALAALREEIVPTTLGTLAGAEVAVTGDTAQSKDFNDQMKTVAPLVFGFVLLFAFVLMLASFRSLVIAAKAIVLNLLSIAAAYGVLVLVFQHGWGRTAPGVRVHRWDRSLPPNTPLRDPLRAVDGLPRLHHQPRPRVVRHGDEHGRGDRPRNQDDGRRRHERRDRHGGRLRDLRDVVDDDPQAVRRRSRRGDPDRRDHRPRHPPTGVDEVARRVELVPADVARVAAAPRARRLCRA